MRIREIEADRLGLASGGFDFVDHRTRFCSATSVVNQDLGSGFGERQSGGAPDAA